MMGNLPDQWARVPLGACLRRRQDTVLPSTIDADSVNVVGLEDVEAGGRGGIAIKRMRPTDAESLKTRFCRGDILYGKLRPYLNKVGIAPDDGLCSTEIWAFAAEDFVDPFFVYAFLSSPGFVGRVSGMTKGANLPRLDFGTFEAVQIPIPPLSEQCRIVSFLQELDQIDALQRTSRIRLARIVLAIFEDRFGNPVKNPRGWPKVNLAEWLSGKPKNGLYKPSGSYGSGSPIIRIGDFSGGRLRDVEDLQRVQLSEKEIAQYLVSDGDILVNRVNSIEYLGKSLLVSGLTEPTVFESNMMRLKVNPDCVLPEYAIQVLQNESVVELLRARAKRAVHQASINQGDLLDLSLPLPPLPLMQTYQTEVREVEALFGEHSDAAAILDSLRRSLVSHAFSGSLTAAWRSRNQAELVKEGADRDAAVTAAGAAVGSDSGGRGDGGTAVPVAALAYTDLGRDQRHVLECIAGIHRYSGDKGPQLGSEDAGFTAADIASALTGPLHNNIHVVEANLAVLVARGLVVALSREQRAPDTDETVYGNCYRLAVGDPLTDQAEGGEPPIGGAEVRDREIRRLLGQATTRESEP